jgi:hypothetical protein
LFPRLEVKFAGGLGQDSWCSREEERGDKEEADNELIACTNNLWTQS